MKNSWMWIGSVVVIVLVAGYVGRHQLKMMFTGYAPSPTVITTSPSTTSPSSDLVMTKTDTAKGNYLVGANGMTLYVFDKDTQGVSNCNDSCAALWPPYLKSSTGSTVMPASMTAIKRADGSMQYTWKGLPLYYYQNDKKVGDIFGDGFNGVWHLVKP